MSGTEAVARIATPFGAFFIDRRRDQKMAAILERGELPSGEVLAIARAFADAKSTVLDIGAHIGTFSVPMAASAGKVVSFEPSPESFALLSRNAAENKAPLTLVNKALGSEKGSGTLHSRSASNAGANTLAAGGDIPVTTLDDEVAHADVIKMDVEGMELAVLRGGARLIERARPVVLFEVNLSQLRAHGVSVRPLARFFTTRGYRLYYPLEKENKLARVRNASLLTAFIAPRAWLFFGESAPFDLVAVPKERAVPRPCTGFTEALLSALGHNLAVKMRRLRARLY